MDLPLIFLAYSSFYKNPSSLNLLSDFTLEKINIEYSKDKKFSKEEISDMSNIFDEIENNPEIILNKKLKLGEIIKNKKIYF